MESYWKNDVFYDIIYVLKALFWLLCRKQEIRVQEQKQEQLGGNFGMSARNNGGLGQDGSTADANKILEVKVPGIAREMSSIKKQKGVKYIVDVGA